ncbi:HPF/RaiA family ribosome-associated protein [Paucibacter sp. Y2R2-4]|uniref:HPF/RaiA family ribosome-associated protein n=1 Tax=Paucibacter sp. Y2R2-4 TaxID=2893553 RepID=UPI0021E46B5E|nr:HPF/RaiA family ribosome-associated protein [Paucibacter sp. Y2R2-4]MCV2350461.1 HPF/RaiA family ribosome-associated protein [Paucibacter sp. Y2R2-4]
MQVLLHSDTHIAATQLTSDHLSALAKEQLDRFGDRITRVEAHLSDVKGHAKTADQAVLCSLEARLKGMEPLVVKEEAGNIHQAIDGAMRKLKRALATALEKQEPRGNGKPGLVADLDAEPSA